MSYHCWGGLRSRHSRDSGVINYQERESELPNSQVPNVHLQANLEHTNATNNTRNLWATRFTFRPGKRKTIRLEIALFLHNNMNNNTVY